MKARPLFFLSMAVSLCLLTSVQATHKLQKVEKVPEGVSKKITAQLDSPGFQVTGPKGAVCEIWMVKQLPVVPEFKPTLNVKYPLTDGQLVGVLQVHKNSQFTDFRGQEVPAGAYTLRYGKQPQDGNHIGTSDSYDFLLAIPAKIDQNPEAFRFVGDLHKKSAKSAGSTHPAIFPLLPVDKPAKTAALSHDEDHDFWIFNGTAKGTANEKDVPVPLKLVVIGRSEE